MGGPDGINRDGTRYRRGVWIAAAIAAAGIIAWNYYYFEQLAAAFIFFSVVFIPILALVFVLVLAEEAGQHGIARTERFFGQMRRKLKLPLARPVGESPQTRARASLLAPRLMRELRRVNKGGFRLPSRRRAA